MKIYYAKHFNSIRELQDIARNVLPNATAPSAYISAMAIIDDLVYWVDESSDLFILDSSAQNLHSIGIICRCGCRTFTLKYGNWEIFATCSSCGITESVYSG